MKKILYDSQGVWKFYYDSQGICYVDPKQRSPMVLFNKGLKDFDVTCDNKNNIYLICQDNKNSIYVFYYNMHEWNKKCILESKSDIPYLKNFSIININSWINTFYVLRHNENFLIVHQVINNNREPEVIESIECEDLYYYVMKDPKDNIYCFYYNNGFGYKRFLWSEKRWEPFKVIHNIDRKIVFISGIFDFNNKYHLSLCVGSEKKYSVLYVNEHCIQEIISEGYTNLEPAIVLNDNLNILFDYSGRTLQSTSLDNGESFMKAKYFFPGSFSRQEIVGIKSSKDLGKYKIAVNNTYGYENATGVFEPAIIGDVINKIDFSIVNRPTEVQSDIEEFAGVQETKQYKNITQKLESELEMIKKQLENNNELKMLFQLAKRLDKIEEQINIIEQKFLNKNDEKSKEPSE